MKRPRRNRKNQAIRSLVQETHLTTDDLVQPLFLISGEKKSEPIASMPGIQRLSLDLLLKEAEELHRLGIQAIALFPALPKELKDEGASEALNPKGLIPQALSALKKELPSLALICDVALDPFTCHGHDGLVNEKGEVMNDETVAILEKMSLLLAEAGADIVAPSDMMDGRVGSIRRALDAKGFSHTSILSYTAKYASSLYAPFRDALSSSLAFGDKKSYQMNPANSREALLEAALDEEEGADMLMIKPALFYLDILTKIRESTHLPLAAYHVSGEYAMVMAAQEKGYLDAKKTFHEALLSIKRAGADFIISYATKLIAQDLAI